MLQPPQLSSPFGTLLWTRFFSRVRPAFRNNLLPGVFKWKLRSNLGQRLIEESSNKNSGREIVKSLTSQNKRFSSMTRPFRFSPFCVVLLLSLLLMASRAVIWSCSGAGIARKSTAAMIRWKSLSLQGAAELKLPVGCSSASTPVPVHKPVAFELKYFLSEKFYFPLVANLRDTLPFRILDFRCRRSIPRFPSVVNCSICRTRM